MKLSSAQIQIITSIGLIAVSFIGIVLFASRGKYAIAEIWFPCITIIGIYGLIYGMRQNKQDKDKDKSEEY